jgi:hypothetical protein
MSRNAVLRPGSVAHACNLNYLGIGEQEDHGSRPAQKKVSKTPCQPIKLGVVAYACHPSYIRGINWRRIMGLS